MGKKWEKNKVFDINIKMKKRDGILMPSD